MPRRYAAPRPPSRTARAASRVALLGGCAGFLVAAVLLRFSRAARAR